MDREYSLYLVNGRSADSAIVSPITSHAYSLLNLNDVVLPALGEAGIRALDFA